MSVGDSRGKLGAGTAETGAHASAAGAAVVPAGGWAILPPVVDDWGRLAEALNAPGKPVVYVDSTAA
ncbi:hypothetical protein [Streptomyces sp. MBT53]|uniref:hypothetical protein n=1 Tax=Streptomyces sp. MBT53 TaxID=1488384 RepID=UPI001912BCB9|nr:hypothetical protein [Streptomyces sp. MBT53]MBK6015913.1 hypothetical protein [Streptomyces sp. MBT53]